MIRFAIVFILLAFLLHSYAEDTIHKLALFDRALKGSSQVRQDNDIDRMTLAKPRYLASPYSHVAASSLFSHDARLRQPLPQGRRARFGSHVLMHAQEEDEPLAPENESVNGMQWTQDMTKAIDIVASEEGVAAYEIAKRFGLLTKLVSLETFKEEGLTIEEVIRLDHPQPMSRLFELKALMPGLDVEMLVARCPELLVAGTNLTQLEKEINTVNQCTEGVPSELLDRLLARAPRVFLMGEPPWDGPGNFLGPRGGGNLLCECVEETKRLYGCQSDLQAIQILISDTDPEFTVCLR